MRDAANVNVEICLLEKCTWSEDKAIGIVQEFLLTENRIQPTWRVDFSAQDHLVQNVQFIEIEIIKSGQDMEEATMEYFVYRMNEEDSAMEEFTNEEEMLPTCVQVALPNASFVDLWKHLHFDGNVKHKLLQYAETAMFFGKRKVNPTIINWNRMMLLHGPPGTGKTSLCKALAQKISIRLSKQYASSHLIEIHAHSLFSKWFSESGKLVARLFQHIQGIIEDPQVLVCVLIDEVESLAAARKAALSGNEPTDAIRVVNALLTQLDNLKTKPNVFTLTTSNLADAVDIAFVDRADIKQYIGYPSDQARYHIFHESIVELMRVGVITPIIQDIPTMENACILTKNKSFNTCSIDQAKCQLCVLLLRAVEFSSGFSGRALRKIPFQAHILVIRQQVGVCAVEYAQAIITAIAAEHESRRAIQDS